MPGLLIKNVPLELQRKLKEMAARHHRSMTREAIRILEEGLALGDSEREFPAPYKGKFELTDGLLRDAKRRGRA